MKLTAQDLMKLERHLENVKRLDVKVYPKRYKKAEVKEAILEFENGEKWVCNLNEANPILKRVTNIQSLMSYFVRGEYGSSYYRGNCTGLIIEDLIKYYNPKFFMDLMMGSGTSKEVCEKLGTPHFCTDLRLGFDVLKNEPPMSTDFMWAHPPYYVPEGSRMPQYSGESGAWAGSKVGSVWGYNSHESDGSQIRDFKQFMTWFNKLQYNLYNHVQKGGRMAILMGDTRHKGQLYSMFKNMNVYGRVEEVIIKEQHNCVYDAESYGGKFIPLAHEYLVIIKKDSAKMIPITVVESKEVSVMKTASVTWRNLLVAVFEDLGGKATLSDLYDSIKDHPKAKNNKHYQEKIRQIVQKHSDFMRIDSGLYKLSLKF